MIRSRRNMSPEYLDKQNLGQSIRNYFRSRRLFCHFRRQRLHCVVESQRACLIGLHQNKARQQLSDWLQAGVIEAQRPTDDSCRCAATPIKSHVTVGLSPDLAEGPPRTCSWAVAQNDRSPLSQQKAISTREGNRLGNAFDTQPAVAARKHGEVCQICG